MFLSSRWGVPSWDIESLPTSEFLRQKLYWERFKWGLGDDLLSMIMSQVLGIRSGNKPLADSYEWKDVALSGCGKIIRKLSHSSGSAIRRGFMSIVNVLCNTKGEK